MIYKHIKTGNKLDLSDYAGALLNLLNTFVEDKCEENFSTCGLTICEAGANMSPENFLRRDYIKSKNIPKPEIDSVTGMTDPDEQRGLMAMLLAANRMASVYSIVARVDEYATKVIQQIANASKKAAIDPGDVVLGNCEKFAVTIDFMRVLSAADMFFYQVPQSSPVQPPCWDSSYVLQRHVSSQQHDLSQATDGTALDQHGLLHF